MTPDEFDIGMAALKSAFPNAPMNLATLKVYERMLLDLDGHVFALAVDKLLATSKYMPTIAEIRSMADEIARPQLDAGIAWALVEKATHRYGLDEWHAPPFGDPLADEAVKAVGWHEILFTNNLPAVRAHFFRIYGDMAKRAKENAVLPERVRALVGQTTKLLEVPK